MKILIIALLLTGCEAHIGLATHYQNDSNELVSDPLGVIRLDRKYNYRVTGFCEHVSSIADSDVDYGLNMCGILYKVN